MPRCEKHDLDLASCADCRPRPVRSPRSSRRYGPWFEASYEGECAGCGDDILAGDRIRADGDGGWLCTDCGEDPDDGLGEFMRRTREASLTAAPPSPAAQFMAQLSPGQRDALDAIAKWYRDGGAYPLTLGGYAGTGKTAVAALLGEVLPRVQIAYVAYTGKAVQVLRGRLDAYGATPAAVSTIHRLLYHPVAMTLCTSSGLVIPEGGRHCGPHTRNEARCPSRQQVSFTPAPDPLAGLDLVVADEASMIPERLWQDLTCHGVPVLAVGDHGQLPPVQSAFSLMANPDLRLEEIHRQSAADPSGMAILNVARWAREQGHIPHGVYGPDVVKISPHELGHAGLHPGESSMILCATNATRAWHNAAMRAWHGRSGPPQPGDVVICLRNNYEEGLFNGQRGVIRDVGESLRIGDEDAWQMTVSLDGLDEPWEGAVAATPFGAPPETAAQIRDRDLALFDYGYALTTHKSQGSQAERVIVIEEAWPPPGTEMRSRWLYTAVTRAEKALTIVGW
jgi:AAA domain-containing protein/UvrD-like helicase family protein